MPETLFSHAEAVQRVREDHAHCAFAFFPNHSAGEIHGGVFFFVEFGDSSPQLRAFRGRFFTGEATTGVYEDADLYKNSASFLAVFGVDPRSLMFKACSQKQIETAIHHPIERNISVLNGHEKVPDSEREVSPEWEALLFQHMPTKEES